MLGTHKNEIAPELTPAQLAEFKEAFAPFDRNGDGSMSRSELVAALQALGIGTSDSEQVGAMLDAAAARGAAGGIDFDDFLQMLHGRMQRLDAPAALRAAFDALDTDGDGALPVAALLATMDSLGERLPHDEAERMLREADADGDGRLTFADFCSMVAACK